MVNKRKSLGRGLGALLGDAAKSSQGAKPVNEASDSRDDTRQTLPVDLLQRGRYQPRVDMRQDSLDELASSIKAQGIVQPIVVRAIRSTGDEQRYEIIAGERRWRAAQLAGLSDVPVVIRNVSDNEAVAMALIENIQREDLNPLEEARALERLIREFDLTHQEGADAVGRSRASVSNLLRLLELGDDVQNLLEARDIDMGHARALLALGPGKAQSTLAAEIAKKKLSVREVEARVRALKNPPKKAATASRKKDPNIARLESDLSEKLGASVAIKDSGGRGSLVIDYASLDQLDGILEKIG
ncbi:MAG: ParB/RepB/Spo0J family partition protein [Pseudomonadota bacterium]